MKVLLAGYNLDVETLGELKNFVQQVADVLEPDLFAESDPSVKQQLLDSLFREARALLQQDNLTPETLSAAYARISRSPKPVNELRAIARREVDRARKSNRNIIFGLGHSSVAEHATFNFDVIGVSRLAVETIEHFRLASYTEKSQRYVLFKNDFVIPDEIRGSALEKPYIELINLQNKTYYQLYDVLRPYFLDKSGNTSSDTATIRRLDGLAKEDARYIISLATQTQLGMTVNARTLENVISKCAAHPLAEIREYGKKLYQNCGDLVPSIIKYVEPTSYLENKNQALNNYLDSVLSAKGTNEFSAEDDVQLIEFTPDAEEKILTAAFFHHRRNSFFDLRKIIQRLSDSGRKRFFRELFRNINSWESVPREFELVDFTFQLIVSAGNYGQLKRHRMANLVAQEYDPNLGVTVPESIIETGYRDRFLEIVEKTNQLYWKLKKFFPAAASYILTNSHRRRVLFKINLRELYHFSRLREDSHAQWDIRRTAQNIHSLVIDKIPLAGALLGGKDLFQQKYHSFFK